MRLRFFYCTIYSSESVCFSWPLGATYAAEFAEGVVDLLDVAVRLPTAAVYPVLFDADQTVTCATVTRGAGQESTRQRSRVRRHGSQVTESPQVGPDHQPGPRSGEHAAEVTGQRSQIRGHRSDQTISRGTGQLSTGQRS